MSTWQELATTSHYQTAVAVRDALLRGGEGQRHAGARGRIDALSRADRRALRSYLIRLMQHIIKWRHQPEKRSRSWLATISNARDEIAALREETPSLTRRVIQAMWERCLEAAINEAEGEMDRSLPPLTLSWEEVFETAYILDSESFSLNRAQPMHAKITTRLVSDLTPRIQARRSLGYRPLGLSAPRATHRTDELLLRLSHG